MNAPQVRMPAHASRPSYRRGSAVPAILTSLAILAAIYTRTPDTDPGGGSGAAHDMPRVHSGEWWAERSTPALWAEYMGAGSPGRYDAWLGAHRK